ncbi:hypothetical protein BGZ73_004251 [Actinomortierella ambigua]|nr:hypothetical protein BGZ73_004251 [Actinomortierella ambigua]
MRLAQPIPLLASIVAIALASLPGTSVHATPAPDPSSAATETDHQKLPTATLLSPDTTLSSSKLADIVDATLPKPPQPQQQQQWQQPHSSATSASQLVPPLPNLASPLDVQSYTSVGYPRLEQLQQQLLFDRLRKRPVGFVPLMPGVMWPSGSTPAMTMASGTGGGGGSAQRAALHPAATKRAIKVGDDPATAHETENEQSSGQGHDVNIPVEIQVEDDDQAAAALHVPRSEARDEGSDEAMIKRAMGGSPTASPPGPPTNVDPEMTCYLDRQKPGVVLCSNGKTYGYYDPAMGQTGGSPGSGGPGQRPPPKLLKRNVYPVGVQHGVPGQPFPPGSLGSWNAPVPAGQVFRRSSGYQRYETVPTMLPLPVPQMSQPQAWTPVTSRSGGVRVMPAQPMQKRGDSSSSWATGQDWPSGWEKPSKPGKGWPKQGGSGGWRKRRLESDTTPMGAGSTLSDLSSLIPIMYPFYEPTAATTAPSMTGSTAYSTQDMMSALQQQSNQQQQLQQQMIQRQIQQQQYHQALQQQQLALQRQQQAAMVRSQLIQNLIATQPEGVVSPDMASSSFAQLEKRQIPGFRSGSPGLVGGGAANVPSGTSGPGGQGPKVIPVPIDIRLLATPDGDLTLLPSDFDPSQAGRFGRNMGGYGGGY